MTEQERLEFINTPIRLECKVDAAHQTTHWHYERPERHNDNTFGWRTVGLDMEGRINLFTYSMDKYQHNKYSHQLSWDYNKVFRRLSFIDILYYWRKFNEFNESILSVGCDPGQLLRVDKFLWTNDVRSNPVEGNELIEEIILEKQESKSQNGDDLYFVKAGENIKIGRSRNVKQRIQQLSTGIAEQPELICVMSGCGFLEKKLHKLFENIRVRENCEWFLYTDNVKNIINTLSKA